MRYSYTTDSNGRITHDGHQDLDIYHNVLNLPLEITDGDMSPQYTYLSDGTKWCVRFAPQEGAAGYTFYRGSFIYVACEEEGDDSIVNYELERVATPDGFVAADIDGSMDLWYAKDHLGNVRAVVNLTGSPEILETEDYMPFGMSISIRDRASICLRRT